MKARLRRPVPPPRISPAEIARYYDRNTPRFLRFGGGGESAAIHRQIWAPGVHNQQQAFLYLNELVAAAIAPALPPQGGHVLDLGCGVGGTSTWLAERLPVRLTGVTNSAVQLALAEKRAQQLGLDERCRFLHADFLALPELEAAQAAFAIESFIHASDAAAFFNTLASHLTPGGRLVLCDDFLPETPPQEAAAQRWIRRFQRYWHAPNLLPIRQVIALAEAAGFELLEQRDLSRYTRSFAPPLLAAMKILTQLPLPSTYWANLVGGVALQVCLRNGWTAYYALTFERRQEGR